MTTAQTKYLGAGLFFLFIFLSGFWLSRSGKPYNSLVFNAHKLIGLGMGVYLIRTVYRTHQIASLDPMEITVIAVTVVLFLGTVVAGGLVSTDMRLPIAVAWVHKLSPYLIVLSTGVTLYLLLNRKL